MLIGLLAALVVASRLPGFAQVFAGSSEALAVVVAATVMFGIGFLDDLLGALAVAAFFQVRRSLKKLTAPCSLVIKVDHLNTLLLLKPSALEKR